MPDTDNANIDDIHILVDRTSIYARHYEIAVLLHKLYIYKYKYYGKSRWKYYDDKDNTWKDDKRTAHLRNTIKTHISDLFTNRYFYWYDLAMNGTNRDLQMTYMEKATNLLKISYNLKMDNFISTVIKEAKGFFDIYNYDD